jgi:hypothetical protein
MNRRTRIRHKFMEWLYDSKVGWIGWLVDGAGSIGCRMVGHEAFPDSPNQCRYCAAGLDTDIDVALDDPQHRSRR